ncbi:MAG TPA: DUF5666 domain-containing protein [Ktedonobacteraceae bacterium]|nr:DUF5666 domain-containing protein [Ktedonobacteraceae bacterium]
MEDHEQWSSPHLSQPDVQHRGRNWLLIGGLAFAFMLALAAGTILGTLHGTSTANALSQGSSNSTQTLSASQGNFANSQAQITIPGANNGPQSLFAGPGAGGQGQCEQLTVSSVNGNTIVAKTASGSSVTIHTTASTQYTQAGKTVSASAIKAGSQISVMGTHNSDGSITATSIDIH